MLGDVIFAADHGLLARLLTLLFPYVIGYVEFFPGPEYVDGTVKRAMMADLHAYPV